MHTQRERVWVSPLMRRTAVKRRLSHVYKSVLQGLCLLPVIRLLFLHMTYCGILLWGHMPLNQDGSQVKASGRSKTHYSPLLSPDFWPRRSPFAHLEYLPCPKNRGGRNPLILYSNKVFPPLCLCLDYYLDDCHDYFLKVFTRDKDFLLTLCLLLPF